MDDRYVKQFANEIAEGKLTLAEGLFKAESLMKHYEWEIWEKLEKLGIVLRPDGTYKAEEIGWDYYDNSLEIIDCDEGFTLTKSQVSAIKEMGFYTYFINYKRDGGRTPSNLANCEIIDD